jgi:leader peptidase (prepilin peptidase)/N-methyltransferase
MLDLENPNFPNNILYLVLAFAYFFGSCWGSFLNVVIYRMPLDMSIVRPRSACPKCRHMIPWYENIPVLSYLFLGGKCSNCHTPISSRYTIIELSCGFWALALAWLYLIPILRDPFLADLLADDPMIIWAHFALWLWLQSFVYAMIAIAFIDLAHTYIPDEISYFMILIGLIGSFALPQINPFALDHFWGMIVGYFSIVLFRWIGEILFKREAMGLGDAKLLAVIGLFLGWKLLPWVLFASATQGLIAALIAHLYSKFTGKSNGLTMTSEELDLRFDEVGMYESDRVYMVLPYGPFLALAAIEGLLITPDALQSLILMGR